ncbi:sigma-54 dependent transcriptional regulator [Pseudodesulfovibrio sp.]|uniref:sigma-54-dependent transcriptional regulator n=1 Tax=Pseudodesulfovibrio sp. TaxID=2035812 RepID=UPI00262D5CFF|nr:sigma-54 dependent transcriptional regulator [Pseudodesulfovibrio sp.]MDD3312727.1 sigma-54 dependent transcriptional regulator [Pseudodesulfovibrio sp.]
MADILIIDGSREFSRALLGELAAHGMAAEGCDTLSRAMALLHTGEYKAVLLGDDLADGDSLSYLSLIQETPSLPEVIILSRSRDPDAAEEAIQRGAWTYVTKPPNLQRLLVFLTRAMDYHDVQHARSIRCALRRSGIIGNSRPLQASLDILAQATGSDANVLITGETGTGKELFARAIHKNSERAAKAFVVVDCAALPDALAESLLFGHQRGAFTSADSDSVGLVKQADGGTLFLDEVGELPVSLQKVFLRVLEGRSFRPVGGVKEMQSDFRLLAATNRDLEGMVVDGGFRRDLFYRLRGIHLHLPPLREITEDINEMVCKFIQRHAKRLHVPTKGFSPDFLDALMNYEWPGNIRELQHTIEQALSLAGTDQILYPRHLPKAIRARIARRDMEKLAPASKREERPFAAVPVTDFPDLKTYRREQMVRLEISYLQNLMEITRGSIGEACKLSGLSRARLYALLKQHDIARRKS